MKKMLTMILVLVSIACFSSCSGNDENQNPMVETKWGADSFGGSHVYVIEFISDNEFMTYMTDKQGNITNTGVDFGTYTYNNNFVKFVTDNSTSPMKNASVKVNILHVTYQNGYTRDFIRK